MYGFAKCANASSTSSIRKEKRLPTITVKPVRLNQLRNTEARRGGDPLGVEGCGSIRWLESGVRLEDERLQTAFGTIYFFLNVRM
jgi:hypothetical protein